MPGGRVRPGIRCRAMRDGEAGEAAALVARVFEAFVAAAYTPLGRRQFLAYAREDRIALRLKRGHRVLVALKGEAIVGVIETRGVAHVSLLFVEGGEQRHGVARALVAAAFRGRVPARGLTVTVNSSPNAVPAYERLGFRAVGAERVRNGIRYVPMTARLHGGDPR